jgi:hypothetical protein
MTEKNIFRLLAILTMGVVFLPIVFSRIPTPFDRPFIYLIFWLTFILLFHTKIFYSYKSIFPIYLFVLVYFISIPLFWTNVTIGNSGHLSNAWLIKEIIYTFLSILMCTYFLKVKDYYGFGLVTLVALTFIAITSLTSIVGLTIFPSATREMVNRGAADMGVLIIYQNMGIGSYGFFSGAVFLFPTLFYYFKQSEISLKLKVLLFCFMLLSFYAIFKSAMTTAFLTTVLFSIAAYRMKGSSFLKQTIIPLLIIILIFIIFSQLISSFFFLLADFTKGTHYEFKFNEMGKAIKSGDFDPNSTQNYINRERLSRSYFSILEFLKNPIIGGGESMGHAFWLDRLGMFGLVGFLPWIFIFKTQIQKNIKLFKGNYKVFYYLSFSAFITYGLFKGGLDSIEISVCVFFLAPGIYFLRYLKKENQ